jgi:hypothetical protein
VLEARAEDHQLWARLTPLLRGIVEEARARGLTDWVHRINGAQASGQTSAEVLVNLRATLKEMLEAPIIWPEDMRRIQEEAIRLMGEALRA